MKKYLLTLIVLVAISQVKLIADTSPFQALRFLGSARATALAGCFVSIPEDPAAVFYNPATIYTVEEKNFSTTFFKHILDINSGQVVYTLPEVQDWAGDGKIAGSVSYNSFGSFDYADEFGNRNGTFGANDISLGATYANELDSNFYYGVTAKLLFINLEKANSFAFAFDAGFIYLIPDKRTNIGLSILHAGPQITTLDGESEPLPLDVRAGVSHRLRGLPLLINFSFHHLTDETENFFDKFLNFSISVSLSG
ncbi:PorV/PorQ family protein [Bacteroidota bacterium]